MLTLGPELFDLLNAKQQVLANQIPVRYGVADLSPAEIASIETQLGFRLPDDFVYLFQPSRPGSCPVFVVKFPDTGIRRQDSLGSKGYRGVHRSHAFLAGPMGNSARLVICGCQCRKEGLRGVAKTSANLRSSILSRGTLPCWKSSILHHAL